MDEEQLDIARADPAEWHRRGSHAPQEIHRVVTSRVASGPTADGNDPAYEDFLGEPVE